MLCIPDTLAGSVITFNYIENNSDIDECREFVLEHSALGIDTESTGLECYRPDWQFRTLQIGDACTSYIIAEKYRALIEWIMAQHINWIAHNGPHDIRCIDQYLGYETGVVCAGETFIPSHHADSRNRQEGGMGHELKELACSLIDPNADKWEKALKTVFKTIEIPVAGEYYKSGPKKGQQKHRKAHINEGWGLIDPTHPTYIAYAGADPLLTYRVWKHYQPVVRDNYELYQFDKRVQYACDRLQRRAIRLDVAYTQRLSDAFSNEATECLEKIEGYGCWNINSGEQLAETILRLGGKLTAMTPTGRYVTDNHVLLEILKTTPIIGLHDFITHVLRAQRLLKRKVAYTDAMLRERDSHDRIHPSIKPLGARTARMSVSHPPLQQLPTKEEN
jgi:DNA polymerase-1